MGLNKRSAKHLLGKPVDCLPPPPATKQYFPTQQAQYKGLFSLFTHWSPFGISHIQTRAIPVKQFQLARASWAIAYLSTFV